jgi:DNA-binding IclR family transcriptional regulator
VAQLLELLRLLARADRTRDDLLAGLGVSRPTLVRLLKTARDTLGAPISYTDGRYHLGNWRMDRDTLAAAEPFLFRNPLDACDAKHI